jgi:hypothetical protein
MKRVRGNRTMNNVKTAVPHPPRATIMIRNNEKGRPRRQTSQTTPRALGIRQSSGRNVSETPFMK